MATVWTEEQKKVIQTRNCNLLVSAAAGSGKTAVLVERILAMIMDKDTPLDIDKLLVVTFTNAAASEMRERIGQRIEEYMELDPENEHLQRQSTLVHMASIMTIDSFCMRVLREHFDETDLDPSFRVGDEGEQRLIKSDVAGELLEDYYKEGSEEFLDFVESYSTGKTDVGLTELIEKMYEFSMSCPDPKEWLRLSLKQYNAGTMEEWNQTEVAKFLLDYLSRITDDCRKRLEHAILICREDDGPFMYEEALLSDLGQIELFQKAKCYTDFGKVLKEIAFCRLSAKKSDSVSIEKREQVKAIRNSVKEEIKSLLKQFYGKAEKDVLDDICAVKPPLQMLIMLTIEFLDRYHSKKQEKNVIDFHDVEHIALNLLAENKDGRWIPTKAAKEYRGQYAQIMIDEYQDSNLVQEILLTSISGTAEGKPNVFMVGDVKQSIYKFRLARPEIFMEKYNSYSLEGGDYQRIDLHKNFRSRSEVLSSVNSIFERIMTKQLGNIGYNDREALYVGASFQPKAEERSWAGKEKGYSENSTELRLIERKAEDGRTQDFTTGELEAKVIAGRIRELTGENGILVWDKEKALYRKACCGDIVILLRSVSSYADAFLSVFAEEGIPAYAQSQSGYFTAIEVQTILNYLRIMDNPRQDIPLAGVLKSPFGGFSSTELAIIKAAFPEGSLYDAVIACATCEKERPEKEKLCRFLENLVQMRRIASYMPVHELIRLVIRETGYGDYIMAMPSGQKRRLNLEMLIEKAYAFEATSYRGLFQFLRYIEKLNKYEIDYGEAAESGENENAVRIISIHKSKGLEFPIVFLAGLGRRFNQQDTSEKIVLHPDMGVGADYVDYVNRTRSVTLVKRILQKSLRLENLAEELRVLYVAMTRAKEKLILTGAISDVEKHLSIWNQEAAKGKEALSYGVLSGASCYLDWIIPAYFSGMEQEKNPSLFMSVTTVPEVVESETARQQEQMKQYQFLLDWDTDKIYDLGVREEIEKNFSYIYPYPDDVALHGKISVSEIKKRSQQMEIEETIEMETLIPEELPLLPEFAKEEEEKGGAARGTLYHRVLERIVLSKTKTREEIEGQLVLMEKEKQLTTEERKQISVRKLWKLFNGKTGERIKQAEKEGRLHREQPFVLGRKAKEFYPDITSEEIILLQGIIDLYFEEEGELVLLDYKTDYVGAAGEELLRKRYYTQFECYKQALEQITGKKVKEMLLYSFALDRVVLLE